MGWPKGVPRKPREDDESMAPTGPDGAVPTAPMTLTGVVRTSKGFAVAVAVLRPDGSIERFEVRRSQAFKQYIAEEHKRIVVQEVLKA